MDKVANRHEPYVWSSGCCAGRGTVTVVGECPHCGEAVDADGDAADQCGYAQEECAHCHFSPCTQSC